MTTRNNKTKSTENTQTPPDSQGPRQREIGPATPSTASRAVSTRGKFSAKGVQRANDDRMLKSESKLEHDTATMLRADRRVLKIEDQPPPIEYVDHDGVVHRHTFDFRVTLSDGVRSAIVVKPSHRAERPEFQMQLSCMARDLPKDFADSVILITEKETNVRRVADAALILAVRRIEDPEADHAIKRMLPTLNGTISLEGLAELTGLAGRGLGAAVRAIDEGLLFIVGLGKPNRRTLTKTVGDGRICPQTLVRCA
jgi:hypothetical protein